MFKSTTCFGKISKAPLNAYESEQEANEAVAFVKAKHQNEQVPYKCKTCGFWHLSPKDRQTPSRKCGCTDEQGTLKDLYPTKEIAERRRDIIAEEKGIVLNIYKCEFADGWHLTHKHYS